jgi:predicted ferric reductase
MGLFFILGAVHALVVPSIYNQLPLVRGFAAILMIIGAGSWVYRAFLSGVFDKATPYEISAIRPLSSEVLEVMLSPVSKGIEYVPGQFVFLSFAEPDLSEPHPFTINSHPGESELRFSIKALGDYTTKLQKALKTGIKAKVEGPYGCFDYRKGKRRQLWLAGGIGITPFLSFLQDVDDDHEITLVWSVNQADEAFYHEEIEALSINNPNFNYHRHVVVTEGYLQLAAHHVGSRPDDCSIYICGPEAMRQNFIKQLVELGIPVRDIHFEEFSFR